MYRITEKEIMDYLKFLTMALRMEPVEIKVDNDNVLESWNNCASVREIIRLKYLLIRNPEEINSKEKIKNMFYEVAYYLRRACQVDDGRNVLPQNQHEDGMKFAEECVKLYFYEEDFKEFKKINHQFIFL